jgi:hypothetical protein
MAKGKGKKPFAISSRVALQNFGIVGIGLPVFFIWREYGYDFVAGNLPYVNTLTTDTLGGKILAYASGGAVMLVAAEFSAIQFVQ